MLIENLQKTIAGSKSIICFQTEAGGSWSAWDRFLTIAPGYDVVFSTNDGKKYISKDHNAPHELEELAKSNPLTEVYAEGFLLQNGKGSFWPILVKTTDGRGLIDKNKMQTSYNDRRWENPMLVMIGMLTISALGS